MRACPALYKTGQDMSIVMLRLTVAVHDGSYRLAVHLRSNAEIQLHSMGCARGM